jgi:hypothetical protein
MLALLGVATIDEAWSKLNSEWAELCAKRDALGGLLTILQVESAEAARAKLAEMTAAVVVVAPAAVAEPIVAAVATAVVEAVRADSTDARAWFHRRAKLHAAAVALAIPASDIDALDDAALRKRVCLTRQPTLRADADEAYYEAAFDLTPVDHLAVLRLTPKTAPAAIRADSAPTHDPYDVAFRPRPRS